ncbi:MAG: hypothetical protein HY002_07625 [Candidatus Rokubacteria bacterium]|nr:hypothetical protein [Candidatus Rokubacteria bacterium]
MLLRYQTRSWVVVRRYEARAESASGVAVEAATILDIKAAPVVWIEAHDFSYSGATGAVQRKHVVVWDLATLRELKADVDLFGSTTGLRPVYYFGGAADDHRGTETDRWGSSALEVGLRQKIQERWSVPTVQHPEIAWEEENSSWREDPTFAGPVKIRWYFGDRADLPQAASVAAEVSVERQVLVSYLKGPVYVYRPHSHEYAVLYVPASYYDYVQNFAVGKDSQGRAVVKFESDEGVFVYNPTGGTLRRVGPSAQR